MKLRGVFKAYVIGWQNFLGSLLYVILWHLILALPVVPVAILLPDRLEGKGAGASLVQAFVLAVIVLWVPLVSYALGMLMFETDKPKPGKRKEPEIEALRGIIASQEPGPATGGEHGDAT